MTRGYPAAMTMPQPAAGPITSAVPPVPDGGGLSAGVMLTLGRIADATERQCRQADAEAAAAALQPVWHRAMSSGVVVNGKDLLLDLGGPVPGRFWVVRMLGTGLAGDVDASIGGNPPNYWFTGKPQIAANGTPMRPASQWIWQRTGAGMDVFSNNQITVLPQDHLFAVVTRPTTSGDNILGFAAVLDTPTSALTLTADI